MAVGWFSVLQAVPWGQVIDNAPKVVDGAKKLWNTVAGRPYVEAEEVDIPTGGDEMAVLQAFKQRLTLVEHSNSELRQQMLASSELIKTLADQNAQLINRIEANRKRMMWLTWMCVLVSAATLGLMAYVLSSVLPIA
jgi:hypothetical protein